MKSPNNKPFLFLDTVYIPIVAMVITGLFIAFGLKPMVYGLAHWCEMVNGWWDSL